MPTLDDIISAIPTFNAEEQERIISAIKASRSLGGARTRGVALRSDMKDDTLLVLAAITDALRRKGMDNTTVDMAAGFSNYGLFVKQAAVIGEWVRGQAMNAGQQRKLYAMMAALLRDDLEKMGLAVTVRLMMQHAHRMQACFHRAFPGYADAGLVSVILNSKEQNHG